MLSDTTNLKICLNFTGETRAVLWSPETDITRSGSSLLDEYHTRQWPCTPMSPITAGLRAMQKSCIAVMSGAEARF